MQQLKETSELIVNFNSVTQSIRTIGKNLNQYVIGEKALNIPKELEKQFSEMLDLTILLLRSDKGEIIFEPLSKMESEDKFWRLIYEYGKSALVPFNESAFLRELDIEKFDNIIKTVFYRYILFRDELCKIDNYDIEQVIIIIKILNSIVELSLVELKTPEQVLNYLDVQFDFERKKAEIILSYIETNKQSLRYNILMKTINQQNERILKISNYVNTETE